MDIKSYDGKVESFKSLINSKHGQCIKCGSTEGNESEFNDFEDVEYRFMCDQCETDYGFQLVKNNNHTFIMYWIDNKSEYMPPSTNSDAIAEELFRILKEKSKDEFDMFKDGVYSLLKRWEQFRNMNPQDSKIAVKACINEINDKFI